MSKIDPGRPERAIWGPRSKKGAKKGRPAGHFGAYNPVKFANKAEKRVSTNSVCYRQGPGGLFFIFLAFFGGKRLRNVDKNGNEWGCKRVLQSRCFFITFFMNFRCFLVVIFCIFFVGAFSNDGWFRKVRHTRKVWFYLVKLMIFKFRVFLQNDPKTDFRVEFRCRKEKNL